MKMDIFFSICQTEVDGEFPSEKMLFENFFDQVKLADDLGFGTAWVAETHLSCEIQKTTPQAVIPNFKGEIGLNTDILQLAHLVFAKTKTIQVGSAIRNILCNGGPIAHAEAIRTFLALHGLNPKENRCLEIGFASGRFEFSNVPYGIIPRNLTEKTAWPVVKGKILNEATEIFLRLIEGEVFGSDDVGVQVLKREDFRSEEDWRKTQLAYAEDSRSTMERATALIEIPLAKRYNFPKLGVIPRDVRKELLKLTLGSHDPNLQIQANRIRPVGVFNLSITPPQIIQATHERMAKHYHSAGGSWRRDLMPRTAMVFIDNTPKISDEARTLKAKEQAQKAWENYWTAMEGTIDAKKIQEAVGNTIAGSPKDVASLLKEKYHPEDRLMLWFDFNRHDNSGIKNSMKVFMEKVVPELA